MCHIAIGFIAIFGLYGILAILCAMCGQNAGDQIDKDFELFDRSKHPWTTDIDNDSEDTDTSDDLYGFGITDI